MITRLSRSFTYFKYGLVPTRCFSAQPPESKQEGKKALEDNFSKLPYASYYNREKVTRKEIRQYLKPYFFNKESMPLFWGSMGLLCASKGLAVASPYILKKVIDAMTVAGSIDFNTAALGIFTFGAFRMLSTVFQEWRMVMITKFIQEGLRKLSQAVFQHLHTLDISFHKVSSKNIVFGVNRAIRSIEPGLRFTIGFFSPIAFEFILLCGMLQFYCGPLYLANMLATLGLYTEFSRRVSKARVVEIRTRRDLDKQQEFTQNESIMNYEAVKTFGNEKLEMQRYENILDKLQNQANIV